MSFADKGAVGDIEPAFFVGYLHRVKATGTLRFEDAPTQRAIYFRDGRILFSSSNAPEDQLGAILVAGGKISQADFDGIVAALLPKQSIAAALSQGGHVSQRDIGDAARRKVEQIVGACCAQTTGRYEFEDGVLPKGALDLKLTTEKVMVAAFDALEPSGFLMRILKSPVAVLAASDLEPVEPDLIRLHGALDGLSSLTDVAARAGLPPAATEARAAVLVVTGGATVVTSQIEEMALPDTGEPMPEGHGFMMAEEAPSFEADTIAFAPIEEPMPAEPEPPSVSMPEGNPEATLMMMAEPEELPQAAAPDLSSEATLIVGSGLDLATPPPPRSPNSSGAYRVVAGTRPPKSRTTTDDLNAVKELISTPTGGTKRPSFDASSAEEPSDSSPGRVQKAPGKGLAALSGPAARPVGIAAAVLIVSGAAWFGYSTWFAPRPVPAAPKPAARVATSAPAPAPPAAASSGAPTALEAPPPAAASPVASGLVEKPPVPPTSAPATPVSPAPTAAPAKAAAPAANQAAAYATMKAGRLDEAAAAFDALARARRGEFTVQLLVACAPETIAKAIQNDPSPDLFIVPASIDGRVCHRVLRGFFASSAEASAALASLPAYYAVEGARPRAISLRTVLR